MYKFVFYVPTDHAENVKAAVFNTGAGKIGEYDQCCWQIAGQGQFRPLAGSSPFIGQADQLETLIEYRVEMVLAEDIIKPVLAALKQAHPYEEPAYGVFQMLSFD